MEKVIENKKECTKCFKLLPLTDYYLDRTAITKVAYFAKCKICCKEYQDKKKKNSVDTNVTEKTCSICNQNKPVIDIINYVKSIWKVWFDLIYNANGEWFLDEYADEDYSWADTNPFDEIKKYDIYYWGITRSFRPLKAEICRSTSNYESSKLLLKNP